MGTKKKPLPVSGLVAKDVIGWVSDDDRPRRQAQVAKLASTRSVRFTSMYQCLSVINIGVMKLQKWLAENGINSIIDVAILDPTMQELSTVQLAGMVARQHLLEIAEDLYMLFSPKMRELDAAADGYALFELAMSEWDMRPQRCWSIVVSVAGERLRFGVELNESDRIR